MTPDIHLLTRLQTDSFLDQAQQISDWQRFFKIASINRVLYDTIQKLYPFSESLARTDDDQQLFYALYTDSQRKFARTQRTYALWKEISERLDVDYRIFKTSKAIFDIPNDLDILISQEDYPRVLEELSRHPHASGVTRANQAHLKYIDFVQIDLHAPIQNAVLVNGTQLFSLKTAWDKPETFSFNGDTFLKPNATADTGLTLLNSLLGHFHISWNEVFTFHRIYRKIDLPSLEAQARAEGWEKAWRMYRDYMLSAPAHYPILLSFSDLLTLFGEKSKSPIGLTSLDRFNALYFLFAKARYALSNKTRVPIHGHWTTELAQ